MLSRNACGPSGPQATRSRKRSWPNMRGIAITRFDEAVGVQDQRVARGQGKFVVAVFVVPQYAQRYLVAFTKAAAPHCRGGAVAADGRR